MPSRIGPSKPKPRPVPPTPSANGTESATARKWRDAIVTAATDIIASEGIHKLSLGRIERHLEKRRRKLSRGQLTYYFRTKEDILLAVFDRLLARLFAEAVAEGEKVGIGPPGDGRVMDRFRYGLGKLMATGGAHTAELRVLAHAFLAQVRHRPDFKAKLAGVNTGWRAHIAADVAASGIAAPPTAVASIIMALFQGLTEQLAVDPDAFDRPAVAELCLRMLGTLFEVPS